MSRRNGRTTYADNLQHVGRGGVALESGTLGSQERRRFVATWRSGDERSAETRWKKEAAGRADELGGGGGVSFYYTAAQI